MFDTIDLGQFEYFHLLRPWWLVGMIPLVGSLLYLRNVRNANTQWQETIAPHLLEALVIKPDQSRWLNPINLSVLVMIVSMLGLSGPTWSRQPSPFVEDQSVLVVILDVSGTMSQQDVQPSRLQRAKQKILDLLQKRKGSRTGVVVYAGSAHSLIPLTNDTDVVANLLHAVNPDIMPRKGKFPEKGLPIADQMLKDSHVPGTILLITDGVSPKSKSAFSEYFAGNDHQLLILGIGHRVFNERSTQTFIPIQEQELEDIVSDTDGYFQIVTHDKSDIIRLARQIDNHLVMSDDDARPWVDMGYYISWFLVPLFLFWFRKGWTLQWVFLLMISGQPTPAMAEDFSFKNLWLTPDQQGYLLFKEGEYRGAAEKFHNQSWKGVAYYLNEDFDAAVEIFSRDETVEGLFNLGNAWAHSQNYVLALQTYDRLLRVNPDHKGALANSKIIQGIVDEINLMSASQQAEQGEGSHELGDEPRRAQGAENIVFARQEVQQFTASEILNNPEINELWMRVVQQDPARFISIKFHMQLEQQK